MEAVREITDWPYPNHTYLLDGTTLIAYIKSGETTPYYFKKGIKGFDKRGRKFVPADADLFDSHVDAAENAIVEVKGSKGNSYFVDTVEKTCTCPGFTFRGNCKHVEELYATV